ncbi:MAG: hypothetical protein ACAH24_17300 [Hyphomicrobiaceae bacterium]|jgi:hypothetical protein
MTSLIEQIEEMRVRMNDLATGEQDLVRALGEALGRADQKLLQDVRAVAQEHEQRRGVILKELQGLAQRMGALPRPRAPFAVLEEPVQELPAQEAPPQPPPAHVFRRGDWREAAANIHDELAIALGPRAATG